MVNSLASTRRTAHRVEIVGSNPTSPTAGAGAKGMGWG